MDKLTTVKNRQPVVCSSVMAIGFEIEHRALRQLIKSHEPKLKKYGKVTFQMQPSESGQKQSVVYLNEKQAMLIMTYTRSNKATDFYRMKLIDDFDRQKDIIKHLIYQQKDSSWINVRKDGKIFYKQKTDVIKNFIEYAIGQGSKSANHYYANFAKMENKALFIFEQKYPNLREILTIKQSMQVSIADDIIEKAVKEGMTKGLNYKDIYKLSKERIIRYVEIVGQSPILGIGEQ